MGRGARLFERVPKQAEPPRAHPTRGGRPFDLTPGQTYMLRAQREHHNAQTIAEEF